MDVPIKTMSTKEGLRMHNYEPFLCCVATRIVTSALKIVDSGLRSLRNQQRELLYLKSSTSLIPLLLNVLSLEKRNLTSD
jgi:hypothetical protein